MPTYVAMLRGIGPTNPNMRNEKLRGLFGELGFDNVRTVISTGNVLFDSPSTAMKSLEKQIETAIPERLGFNSSTIVRRKKQIQDIVDLDPFKGVAHSPKMNLNVTFLKSRPRTDLQLPHTPKGRAYTVLGIHDRCIFSTIDLTSEKTPDLMRWLEKEFGKEITTRTYKTVQRILKKLNEKT